MNRRSYTLAVLLLLIVSLLAACGEQAQQQNGSGAQATEPAATEAADATTPAESDATTPPDGQATAAPEATTPADSSGQATTDYPTEDINIMAPASPGGGWDQTARAVQAALNTVMDQKAQVYNVPGAGGTIGLARFVNEHSGNPHQLMMTGLVMVGAIKTNQSPVDLSQVTPLATLTTEWEAIVVPANSKYQDLKQLLDDFKANPTSISWGGGSAGSTDHILVALLAKELGVDPGNINYVAHSGGGEAMSAFLSGAVTAGVSGLNEVVDQVESGGLRLLAVSSEERLPELDAPTIVEAGYNVTLPNWRGIVAPPEISPEQQAGIIAALEKMHESEAWQQQLQQNGWVDFFKTGDEFASFLEEETTRMDSVLRDIGLIQ